MSWVDHIEGTLPADDLRRAFVMGAKWWHYVTEGATMFPSDRQLAEEQAEQTFPGGKPPSFPHESAAQAAQLTLEV